MDRLDAMRVFAAVADLGSFVGAARRLRLSPAAVSRAVRELEDHLGTALLARTTRSVRLTESGALFHASCKRLIEDVAEAERRARGQEGVPRGVLTVAAPVMFGRLHVLPVVTALLRQNTALSVRLTLSDRFVQLVEEGVDVAIRIGALADSALRALPLAAVRRVLAASPAYLEARGIPQSPAELDRHDLIDFEGIAATSEWRFGAGMSVRIVPRLAVNTAEAAIMAAIDGLGVVRTLSYQVHEAVAAGRLRLVLEEFAPPPIPVSAVYPEHRQGSPNLAAFLAAAKAHFRGGNAKL